MNNSTHNFNQKFTQSTTDPVMFSATCFANSVRKVNVKSGKDLMAEGALRRRQKSGDEKVL